jgi:hypothetical protein
MRKLVTCAFALACSFMTSAAAANAQSLFATRGLGLPVAAVDARARALGGIGVGIAGLSTSLANPAEIAGLTRTGVTAALQPTFGTVIFGGEESDLDGARFPLVRIVMPLSSRIVATLGYGGVLEQSFGIRTEGTEVVGSETLRVIDDVTSSGGLSEIGVGLAWVALPGLAVGATGGLYAGNQQRVVTRTFADTTVSFEPFAEEFRWEYRAPFVRVGARWDPAPIMRLGASVTMAGDIDVSGQNFRSPNVEARSPIRLTVGGSGFLGSGLLLAAGAERLMQRGSGRVFENDPESSAASDTWRVGGGLEWGGLGSGARAWPIRIGASWAQLPYHASDETQAEEWSITGGVGFRLAGDPADPQALLDATLERGNRSGLVSTANPAGLEERYWRFTVSLSLFGR